jgi:hypothetical protein
MAIIWKRNGVVVPGPGAIPDRSDGAAGVGVAVRGNYAHPIELQSMGFLGVPEDVAEHRRRFPNVELRMMEGSAIPVVRSRGEKKAYLKAAGWVDSRSYD